VFASSERTMQLRSGNQLQVSPLKELPRCGVGPHLLAHYAFATRELVSQMGISEYIAANEEITELVATHVRRASPLGMVVLSSGAVYLGSDLATNPYGVLKARDERRFLDLATEVEPTPRVVVPRLFNLAGPFLNKPDYVLGSIIRDIQQGGPIRLHATGPVVRSYVHVGDFVDLSFAVMLGADPTPVEAFDTAGEREIEVGALAELAAFVLGQPGMAVLRPPPDGAEPNRYVGDPTVFHSLAHSYGITLRTLERQIEDTARFMRR